ncbi:MAG: hypothetical protein ACI4JD_05820 [Ruminococcus sp.]
MKIFKKTLTWLIASAMMTGALPVFGAEAVSSDSCEIIVPEEYSVYDDSEGLFEWTGEKGAPLVLVYNDEAGGICVDAAVDYYCNYSEFAVAEGKTEEFDSIYEKYRSLLEMDNCSGSGIGKEMYDYAESFEDITKTKSKYQTIKEMAAELYQAGCISSASYCPVNYLFKTGQYYGNAVLEISGDSDETEKLTEIGSAYESFEKIVADPYSESTESTTYHVYIDITELNAFAKDVNAAYGDNVVNMQAAGGFIDKIKYHCFGSVNLLDPYICDIDESGAADIADAALLLAGYSESAAGIQQASAEGDKMDVNGDGVVDVSDAAYILDYYAQASAGIR